MVSVLLCWSRSLPSKYPPIVLTPPPPGKEKPAAGAVSVPWGVCRFHGLLGFDSSAPPAQWALLPSSNHSPERYTSDHIGHLKYIGVAQGVFLRREQVKSCWVARRGVVPLPGPTPIAADINLHPESLGSIGPLRHRFLGIRQYGDLHFPQRRGLRLKLFHVLSQRLQ